MRIVLNRKPSLKQNAYRPILILQPSAEPAAAAAAAAKKARVH